MNKPTPSNAGFHLQTAKGGILSIGVDDGGLRVAARPDGAVYVGALDEPMLARRASGEVMAMLDEGLVAKIGPDGTMSVFSGDDCLVVRPNIGVVSPENEQETAASIVEDVSAIASELLKGTANFMRSDVTSDPVGVLLLSTGQFGAVKVRRANSELSILSRRDGAAYFIFDGEPIIGRMPDGNIIAMISHDLAVHLGTDGSLLLASDSDALELLFDPELHLVSNDQTMLATSLAASLRELGEVMAEDVAPAPSASAAPQGSTVQHGATPIEQNTSAAADLDVLAELAFGNHIMTADEPASKEHAVVDFDVPKAVFELAATDRDCPLDSADGEESVTTRPMEPEPEPEPEKQLSTAVDENRMAEADAPKSGVFENMSLMVDIFS